MIMWARKRIPVKVVELLVQEEAVMLDVKNKNGLKPEEVTQDSRIKELLREEHWRRARSEVSCWHLMTKLSIWCWCLRKTLFLIQDGARGGAFGATRTTRSWGAFLAFLSFLFHLWKALLYLFIGLDLGETAGEGKASYQGEIYQVYNNTPYTWLKTGKLCTSTQDMIHIFLGRLSCWVIDRDLRLKNDSCWFAELLILVLQNTKYSVKSMWLLP